MKKIAVFTSGGDAPGMNACLRAVVRTGIYHGLEVYGIQRGYEGMIAGEIELMTAKSVANIIQRGGTVLGSARSERFYTPEGREQAFKQLEKHGIEGVVAIGGDGTFTGANLFGEQYPVNFIGVPGTIDNDLYGTDFTIGYDTALNTVMEAVDKIRDTAAAHHRMFFIEVMGRDAGFIALRSGISTGAEAVLIPETSTYIDRLFERLEAGVRSSKTSSIVIVAEGDDEGGAYKVAKKVKERFDHYDIKVTILGHIQRGGSPSAMDRVLASHLGAGAVDALLQGKRDQMVGLVCGALKFTPFDHAIKHHKTIDKGLLDLTEILAI
jgi:6-phosphofructokinase 1